MVIHRDPNLPLLRKAVEWAETEANRPWTECAWYQDQFYIGGRELGKTCETAFCIAGYVVSLDHSYAEMRDMGAVRVSDLARDLLGLTHWEAGAMFAGGNSLEEIQSIAALVAQRAGEEL